MQVFHVYKRPGYDKLTSDYDEFAAGEWHYCGTWSDEEMARKRADGLVEDGTSVRLLASELDPQDPTVYKPIEFGVPVYRPVLEAILQADQEILFDGNTASPITQSPDSSPSKSRLAPFDLASEDWFKICTWF